VAGFVVERKQKRAMLSVREVCEKIWAMETDLSLFERTFGGVPLWPLNRMKVYYRICQGAGLFSTPHSERITARHGFSAVGNTLAAPFRSPLLKKQKRSYLVFDHPRKVLLNGEYVDIYTKQLLETLPPEETEVFENWQFGRHLTRKTAARTYLDSLAVGSFFHSLVPHRFTKEEKASILEIENRIQLDFDVRLPLLHHFGQEVRHHCFGLDYFSKLLEQRAPKRVYLVVSYSHYKRALICAAKRLGIETVEIQHGTFSPYHLGYNFPNVETEVPCFPDRFYSFGDYWNDLAKMPIGKERIETWGFDHFCRQLKTVQGEPRDPKAILVVSQGVIGKQLSSVVAELALKLPDYHITCKLHPGEYTLWRKDYPALVDAAGLRNVTVVDQDKIGLYTRFARSRYLVGVFSTAIYEGLALGCTTFIVDLPGAEYMDYLVDKKMVIKVKTADDIAEAARAGAQTASFESEFIFATRSDRSSQE
jgi:hypothetical protein